jgi:hypothetical protein
VRENAVVKGLAIRLIQLVGHFQNIAGFYRCERGTDSVGLLCGKSLRIEHMHIIFDVVFVEIERPKPAGKANTLDYEHGDCAV